MDGVDGRNRRMEARGASDFYIPRYQVDFYAVWKWTFLMLSMGRSIRLPSVGNGGVWGGT